MNVRGTEPVTHPSACPSCGCTHVREILCVSSAKCIWLCRSCDLGFLWPKKDQDELDRYYKDTYYKEIGAFDTKRLHMFESDFRTISNGLVPGKLFDFGCGLGHFMLLARQKGWAATGSDVAPQAVEYATRELQLDVRLGGVDELAVMGTGYRLVTVWNVLDHLSDPTAAMKKLHDMLEPGGRIAVRSNNFAFRKRMFLLGRMLGIRFLLTNFGFFFDSLFTPGSYRRLLGRCGFTNISVRNSSIAGNLRGKGPGRIPIILFQTLIDMVYHATLGAVCLGPSMLITAQRPRRDHLST